MSSKSPMRIVLVDLFGEILFSGESVAAVAPAAIPSSPSMETCPETQRSATMDSGIYAVAGRATRDPRAEPALPPLIRSRPRAA